LPVVVDHVHLGGGRADDGDARGVVRNRRVDRRQGDGDVAVVLGNRVRRGGDARRQRVLTGRHLERPGASVAHRVVDGEVLRRRRLDRDREAPGLPFDDGGGRVTDRDGGSI